MKPLGRACLSATAVVRNKRSPHTIGDDQPAPGNAVRQATLCSLAQVSGNDDSATRPMPVGPRNCGHSAAHAGAARKMHKIHSTATR